MKTSTFTTALAVAVAATFSARADLKLPAIFGDNMVLQQQMPVPVWGWAAPAAKVTVKFSSQSHATQADAEGRWQVDLTKLNASFSPQTLAIEAGETKTFTNVLVGEVWLGSGQSNMEKPIGEQRGQKPCLNAETELAAAHYPNMRLFSVGRGLSATPRADLVKFQGWRECNSNALNAISFSAAAYFFGREIHTNLNVPVGLVESAWGGRPIEPFTPQAGFKAVPALAKFLTQNLTTTTALNSNAPSVIYNAMIAPLAPFAIRGALWYQGESNRSNTNYTDKMVALIGGWRQVWQEGDFPFYFVQVAPYRYIKTNYVATADRLPDFWLQQSRAAQRIKNTGMVVTTDLVDDLNDIHPRDKQSVGHRLALLALNQTYGQKSLTCFSPAFRDMKVVRGKAVLRFDHAEGGLRSKDGNPLTWFTIAGADKNFVPAEARIVGDTVEVSAAGIEQPVAVRLAWNQIAQPNLCNGAGLPAEPFSTDDPVK